MIRAAWINLRTLRVLWCTPVLATLLLLVAAPGITQARPTSLSVSAAAAYGVFLWAPAQLLLGYAAIRSTRLVRDDPLAVPSSLPSRARRVGSALVVPATWGCLGWIAYWAGCDVVARRSGAGTSWWVAMNGCALTVVAVALGSVLAVSSMPAWVAALGAGGLWGGLALWSYLPPTPWSILLEAYSPQFLSAALPSPARLTMHALWAVVVAAGCVAWMTRAAGGRIAITAVLVLGVVITVIGARTPLVLPRAGNLSMHCRAHAAVPVCLWSDHESARKDFNAGVDLARRLVGGGQSLPSLREGDIEVPPAGTIPRTAARAAVTTSSAHPEVREVAAALVAEFVVRGTECDEHTTDRITDRVELLVVNAWSPTTGRRLSAQRLRSWILDARRRSARCQEPAAP